MGEIVVGVDGSPGAAAALQWAAREAALHDWGLIALLAWGYTDSRYPLPGEASAPRHTDHDARAALDAAVAIALGVDAARRVRHEVACDLAVAALVERSRRADLLVMGARGLDGFHSLLLGSVSDQCTHLAACPVAVIHAPRQGGLGPSSAEPPPHDRHIVVGVDGSPVGQRALRWALEEARLRQVQVDVVHAWKLPMLVGPNMVQAAVDGLKEAGRAVLERALDGEETEGVPRIRRLLFSGSPAAAILETAQGADLVVVGTRGADGVYGLLVGSVSRQVVHHAPCPVVVIPAERQRDDPSAATERREELIP